MDYRPPVDIAFGDYLRALISADRDLVANDPRGRFRCGLLRSRLYPQGVRHLSPGNLRRRYLWRTSARALKKLKLTWSLDCDRRAAYETGRENARTFHDWLVSAKEVSDVELDALGFVRQPGATEIGGLKGDLHGIDVHSVRLARRIGPDGQSRTDLIVEITQTFVAAEGGHYRGGCTLVIDLDQRDVRYFIRKRLGSPGRIEQQRSHLRALSQNLREAYFDAPPGGREPFALLHNSH